MEKAIICAADPLEKSIDGKKQGGEKWPHTLTKESVIATFSFIPLESMVMIANQISPSATLNTG